MTQLLRRRYRFMVEVDVTVDNLTDELVEEHANSFTNADELLQEDWFWEEAERNRRLLNALLAEPELLDRFIRAKIATEMGMLDSRNLEVVCGGSNASTFEDFAPVIARLPDGDQRALEEAEENNVWIERTIMADNTINVHVGDISLVELPTTKPVRVKTA